MSFRAPAPQLTHSPAVIRPPAGNQATRSTTSARCVIELLRGPLVVRSGPLVSRQRLEFDLLREPKRIVHFHAEIANGCLDLCVPEQQLYRP